MNWKLLLLTAKTSIFSWRLIVREGASFFFNVPIEELFSLNATPATAETIEQYRAKAYQWTNNTSRALITIVVICICLGNIYLFYEILLMSRDALTSWTVDENQNTLVINYISKLLIFFILMCCEYGIVNRYIYWKKILKLLSINEFFACEKIARKAAVFRDKQQSFFELVHETELSNDEYAPPAEWVEHAYPLQQFTIKLQGTRHSDRQAVIAQLDEVFERLRSGENIGENHDDDYGYSFAVVSSSNGPSFFNGPAGQK